MIVSASDTDLPDVRFSPTPTPATRNIALTGGRRLTAGWLPARQLATRSSGLRIATASRTGTNRHCGRGGGALWRCECGRYPPPAPILWRHHTTDANKRILFQGLAQGAYVVVVKGNCARPRSRPTRTRMGCPAPLPGRARCATASLACLRAPDRALWAPTSATAPT